MGGRIARRGATLASVRTGIGNLRQSPLPVCLHECTGFDVAFSACFFSPFLSLVLIIGYFGALLEGSLGGGGHVSY